METNQKTQSLKRLPITNHHELRIDVGLDCSQETHGGGADQSFKNQCDINLIMKQYEKTGMLPQQTSIPARYSDNTNIPSLEAAFEATSKAMDAFYELPPEVRRHMDNDPSQLENFINNDENIPLLKKHGIIIERAQPEPTLRDVINQLKENNKPTE